jgi:hypothetical protein
MRARGIIAALLLGLTAVGGGALGAEDAPQIKLSDWRLARFRYGQGDKIPKKVEAHITVTNTAKKNLEGLKSRLTYYASTGEKVKDTSWQFALVIPAGKSKTFKYVAGLVPAFEAYELRIEYTLEGRKCKYLYRSPDPLSLPKLWSDKPIPGTSRLVIVGREVFPDPRTRRPKLYLRVKNLGEKPATGAAVTLEFLGKGKKVLYTFERKLGNGTVAGGKEKTFNFLVDKVVGGYAGYRVRLKAAKISNEESLSGGVFSDRPELEIAHFKFTRKSDGSLYITAKIRNGRKKAVTNPTVVINLTDKSEPPKAVKQVPFEVTGTLKPGDVRAFALSVPKCPSFGSFSYEIEFSERSKEVAFKPITAKVPPGKVAAVRIDVRKGPAGELQFVARVVSRAPYDVTAVKLLVNLMGGPGGKTITRCAGGIDKLAKGKSAVIIAEVIKPPKFTNFSYRVVYTEPTPPKFKLPDRKKR